MTLCPVSHHQVSTKAAKTAAAAGGAGQQAALSGAMHCVMHSPYTKLVRKAHAWLHEADILLSHGSTQVWQQLHPQVGAAIAWQEGHDQRQQHALLALQLRITFGADCGSADG